MKVRDLILISIIIAVLALATYNITIEQYTEGGILGAIAFYTLTYVIISIVCEKRLESELVMVKKSLKIRDAQFEFQNRKREEFENHNLQLIKDKYALETDLANQVKATDILQKRYDNLNSKDESIIKDIPFSEDTPYIGQMVKVKYGSTYKVAPITRILDEGAKGLRYRVRGCGSAKYKVSDFRDYDENEIPDYGVKLTKKE